MIQIIVYISNITYVNYFYIHAFLLFLIILFIHSEFHCEIYINVL